MSATPIDSIVATIRKVPYIAWVIFYAALSWGVFGALLGAVAPNLRAELNLDFQAMGTLMAVWSAGSAIGSLMGGSIAQLCPPQLLFLLYSCATLLGVLMIVQSQSYAALLLCFGVIALFETALFTLGHGIIAQECMDAEERGRILSLVDVGYSFGTLASPLVVGLAYLVSAQWRSPYWVFAVLVLALILAFLPRKPFQRLAAQTSYHEDNPQANSYRTLLLQPVVLWMVLAGLSVGIAEWGQYFWFVSYAVEDLEVTEGQARFLLGAIMAGMVVGRLWQAFALSCWSMGQKIQALAYLAWVAMSGLVVWGWLLQTYVTAHNMEGYAALGLKLVLVTVINFAFGLGVSVAFPILLATAIACFPAQASRLSALLMIAITLGAQIAALGVGALSDLIGLDYAYATLWLAMCSFVWSVRKLNMAVGKAQ